MICTIFVNSSFKMKGIMIRKVLSAVCAFIISSAIALNGQERLSNGIEFDKYVHNFGDVMLDDGPVSCTFSLTNKGNKPVVIYNVTTTCGCTDVEWTREPIKSGGKGQIKVTYSNDEGPYPFDKSLTVYMSDEKKPVILKLRGISNEKPRPLEELYPVHYGSLGLKESAIQCGNLEQGGSRSDAALVANLSSSPMNVTFSNVSDNLSISVSPNPIPAKGTAEMRFTVKADRKLWGKNTYWATPLINGKAYKNKEGSDKIGIWAFTKENFSNYTDEQKQKGPMPRFETSTYSFGKAKVGDEIHATYTFKNEGKSDFLIYKVDADACCYSHSDIPAAAPGEKVSFRVHVDTDEMKKGETLTIITLTTNSPTRPIINLFVSGILE